MRRWPAPACSIDGRLFHPANDHYGLSPIEAAASAIDLHNAAARWNKALLDNSARPSGALVYSNGQQMTAEQFERLKSELEASFQGTRNAGRPLLLEGGLDWKAMSLTPRDLDFMEAKHAAAREIALAIGVPPMLLGIPGDNTYANYAEANRAFWRQTVLPLVQRTARALTLWLTLAYGTDLRFSPDLDQVEALSPEREALWARMERTSFLSNDEKRAAVGYGAKAEGGDSAKGPFARKYREDQARDDQGRWVDEGGGEDEQGRGSTPEAGTETSVPSLSAAIDAIDGNTIKPSSARPITLAQATGGRPMEQLEPTSITSRGITLTAPEGHTLSTFTVPPLANPVQSPLGNIPVAGALGYFAPGPATVESPLGRREQETGAIMFVTPQATFIRDYTGE